ncbi:MAG: sulfite exporter TauE/SafE family protein, partial [Burkholderiales bacterium]|nr:sulfite exporter TauE/SafE family protein [Burkholderiales bacterium]
LEFARRLFEHRPAAWLDLTKAAIVLAGATLSSLVGFAFAPLTALGLIGVGDDPVGAIHTILCCSIAIQLYAVWQLRKEMRWAAIWPMLAGGALAAPWGIWLLLHLNAAGYRQGLGLFLGAYGAYSMTRIELRPIRVSRRYDVLAGALAGLVGGMTAFPGALMTIWCSLRGWEKWRQRAVYQPFILSMQLVSLASLHALGGSGSGGLGDLGYLVFALLGARWGFGYFQRLSGAQFRRSVGALLLLSGLGLWLAAGSHAPGGAVAHPGRDAQAGPAPSGRP